MATWASNPNCQVLLDFETTFKTDPVTPAAIQLPINSNDLKVDQVPQPTNLIGAGRHSSAPWFGNKAMSGTLTGPVDLIAIGYILKMAMGAPATTGSGPYVHTYKIPSSLPTFLLDKGWTDVAKYYKANGCVANGITFTFNETSQFLYSVPLLGAKETPGTSPYNGSPTDLSRPSKIFDLQDVSDVSEGGSPVVTLEELSFNLANNSVFGYGLGSGGEATLKADGLPAVTGRLRGMFTDDTILAKARAKTESSLSITLTEGSYSLVISADELKYSQQAPAIAGPAGVYLDLTFLAYYQDDADETDLKIVLTNSQDSYA